MNPHRQDFSALTDDSKLDAPVFFASAMSDLRRTHGMECDAAIPLSNKLDFFKARRIGRPAPRPLPCSCFDRHRSHACAASLPVAFH